MKKETVSITKQALIDLVDQATKLGYRQAILLLQELEPTAGMTMEQKEKMIEELL